MDTIISMENNHFLQTALERLKDIHENNQLLLILDILLIDLISCIRAELNPLKILIWSSI